MKVLHTADWHIGRTLYGRKRYEEFEAFLVWLAEWIELNQIDVLLVAGDIFDTSTPSNRAQELYYRFLCRMSASTCCRHVVVTGGNHDSPSFLNAPKELLRALNVYVVGSACENPEDEVLLLCDEQNEVELIVCAVPYLRDRDIRVAEAGESTEDKQKKLIEGIRKRYAAVGALAEQKRKEQGASVPIIGMGHLFTAGCQTVEGDGVRELYVGSLAHVTAEIFPTCFDYLALGHLHIPQKVAACNTMRYSGSPLPLGFGEATQQKSVCQIDFNSTTASVQLVDVPRFQMLERVKGDWGAISNQILKLSAKRAWLEVIYEGAEVMGDLRERVEDMTNGTQLEILRIKNNRTIERILSSVRGSESLDDLDVREVFQRCLAAHEVAVEQRAELLSTYNEALVSLHEEDRKAE